MYKNLKIMIVRNESYVKQMKKTLNIYHLLKEEFKLYDIYQDFNDLYMLKDGTVVRRLKFYMSDGLDQLILQFIIFKLQNKGYNVELKSLKLYDGVGYDENVKIIKIKA